MSYDLFIFRPKAGVSIEWINTFIVSEEANDENADPEEIEAKYIDTNVDQDDLTRLVAGPLIKAMCDQDYTQEEIDSWIEDPDYDSDLGDCMDQILEYHEGYQIMLGISAGGADPKMADRLWEAIEELYDRGLVVLDAQLDRLLDIGDDREEFTESLKESVDLYEDEGEYGTYDEEDDEDI